MNEKLYVVTREGVYRHEIVGVFDDQIKACEAAKDVISKEPDDYHSFAINEFLKNVDCDKDGVFVAAFFRKGLEIYKEISNEWYQGMTNRELDELIKSSQT